MTAAVCLVLDVGIHMSASINEAVKCLKLLLQRKFFAEKREEVALILFGTSATSNDIADADGNFSHISMVRELSPLDWDILEYLNNESFLSTDEADVVDALIVAVSHLVSKCEYAPLLICSPDCFLGCRNRRGIQEKRVLLISNLEGPADNAQIAKITDNLRAVDVQFSLIGCNVHTKRSEQIPSSDDVCAPGTSTRTLGMNTAKLTPAHKAVTDLWCQFNGESYTFDEAIPALAFFETRDVAQRGWSVNLDIGDSLRLPVVGYTQVKEAHPPSLKLLYAANPATPVRLMTSYHAQDAAATELKPTEVVRGYRYGNTLVPFSVEDMIAVKPNSEKCLSLIGFTNASNVPRHLYVGDSVLVFVANSTPDDDSASNGLAALAQALFELDGVALVRRVYNRVSAPRLGVLTPEIRDAQVALVYTDLAFADDYRPFEFPTLPLRNPPSAAAAVRSCKQAKTCPTDEQLRAMNQFVDSMMLGNAADNDDQDSDQEDFVNGNDNSLNVDVRPERLPNPWIQRLFTCFRERGLNPARTLLPSTSQQLKPSWLDPNNLPGLEQLLTRIDSLPSCSLQAARANLLATLPDLSSVQKGADGDSELPVAKRRRLMAAELFGIKAELTENRTDTVTSSSSPVVLQSDIKNAAPAETASQMISTVDPVGDFERLIVQEGQVEFACERMQEVILMLVTDPYTGCLLRPKAIACLLAYREQAKQTGDLKIARAYNTFIRSWREDLELRGLLTTHGSQTQSSTNDARLSFWVDTITQGGNWRWLFCSYFLV
ncbi:ATP-dependent DNA helicase 2 subunit 2 [Paragonimus westermani]|uniref:ATP-dependent DNA helicase 2 subunit 2 n=1 Tax=Paragonimus westermani TaxID=34504 RepID=A0A5J4P2M0_9TREM|nr:ATP-dependent DNA helicase 2 subunit 2 [Paragonimus westermani]